MIMEPGYGTSKVGTVSGTSIIGSASTFGICCLYISSVVFK